MILGLALFWRNDDLDTEAMRSPMMMTVLSRCDGFRDTHFVGHVADDGQADLVRFGGSGEIRIVGDDALNFEEVDALRFKRIDSGDSTFGRGDLDRAGET